jgi:D-aminoacyl-tRNA deacylase
MKLVIQRVTKAEVKVKNKSVGKIGKGLLVLLGVSETDSEDNADLLAEKLAKMRLMSDENNKHGLAGSAGKMNLSIVDANAEILVVSQFTLYANTEKGNRPSFIKAAEPEKAEKLYKYFVTKLLEMGIGVETGTFGSYMEIESQLDGPVTIVLEK